MSGRFVLPIQQWLNASSVQGVGYLLYFYQTGTTTPKDTYTTHTLGTANANPVVMLTDQWPPIFLADNLAYKVVLKTAAGATVWTADPVTTSTTASSVSSITNLKALDVTLYSAGAVIYVTQAGIESFFTLVNSAYSDNGGTVLAPTVVSGNYHWQLIYGNTVRFSWFQPALDNTTDDAAKLQAAITVTEAIGEAGILVFPDEATLKVIGTITQTGCTVDLNGSIVNMTLVDSVKGWQPRSNTTLRNGRINAVTSGSGGSGEHRTPFVIGDYNSGTGYNDIVIRNMTFGSDKAGGAIALILGDSYNVSITDITIPTNTTLATVFSFHWGGATDPTAGTYHPHDCEVRRVTVGDLTYENPSDSGYLDQGLFGTSGAFNIVFSDIDIGYAVNHAYYSYCGDNGSLYSDVLAAQVGFNKIINRGILYERCSVRDMNDNQNTSTTLMASVCKVRGDRTTSSAVEVMGVEFKQIRSEFLAGTPATLTVGVHILNADSPKITDCTFANFRRGLFTSRTGALFNRNVQVSGGSFQDSQDEGIYLQHVKRPLVTGVTASGNVAGISALSGCYDPVIDQNQCYNNSDYGIYMDADGGVVSKNQLGITGGTQDVGVRAAPSALSTKFIDNNCLQATTAAFTLGSTLAEFRGNSVVTGTTLLDDATKLPIGSSTLAVGSATALTTATAKTITSFALPNGIWAVSGVVVFDLAGGTVATEAVAAVSPTTNTVPTTGTVGVTIIPTTFGTAADIAIPTGMYPATVVDGTDTYYLVGQLTFTVSTAAGYGTIKAVKIG